MSGLLDSISFFTIFPAGNNRKLDRGMIKFFTVAGLIAAILPALAFYGLSLHIGSVASSAVSLSLLLLISGFNHLDGVLDSGDAIMSHSDTARRREILKDRYTGAGGIGTAIVIYLTYFAVLSSFKPLDGFFAILVSEMSSKLIMVMSLGRYPTFGDGLATLFKSFYRDSRMSPWILNAIPAVLISLLYGISGVLSLVAALIFGTILASWISGLFDGLNGDTIALSGESARVFCLLFLALALSLLPHTGIFGLRLL